MEGAREGWRGLGREGAREGGSGAREGWRGLGREGAGLGRDGGG